MSWRPQVAQKRARPSAISSPQLGQWVAGLTGGVVVLMVIAPRQQTGCRLDATRPKRVLRLAIDAGSVAPTTA